MLEIKNGNETMTISNQADCISIVHRQYSPYKDFAETTAFTIDKEDLLDILRPLAKLVKDERNEVFI
jgi:hypothetical protein